MVTPAFYADRDFSGLRVEKLFLSTLVFISAKPSMLIGILVD
jgi:hypothetical protein